MPIRCERYGLKVSKLFDGGDATWLGMENGPGEWAVAFHGVNRPNERFQNYKNRMHSILNKDNKSLEPNSPSIKPGPGQIY